MRRAEPRSILALALVAAAATAALLAAGGSGSAQRARAPSVGPGSWRGLVGSRPRVAAAGRVIVVLRTPSLAQRVTAAGGRTSAEQERAWTSHALAAQELLVSRLALQGVAIHPDYSFARVLDGFSASVDPSAIALLEHDPEVVGVYPVRVAYPASVSADVLAQPEFGPGSGHRLDLALPGMDGRGVTIALLDTGVDAAVPFLRGRVRDGIDLVGGDPNARAQTRPGDTSQVERHGTQMAGLLVGAGGPGGLAGAAPGAEVLPIRVAGWQPDGLGQWAVYARSDQVVAGLDRAVDPSDDGDAHDAARVALVALATPFAGFADGPEARAVAGATALGTLVVAPAGNDGAAADGYGDLSGPGGARAVLTVGAADTRPRTAGVRLVVRSGLDTLVDRTTPLVGVVGPARRLDLRLAVPRGTSGKVGKTAPRLREFFSRDGVSLVAGRAALVSAGAAPAAAAERAARAGAAVVLLYGLGRQLPAGALGLADAIPVPVVSLSRSDARALLARLDAGVGATASLGAARPAANPDDGAVADFSSGGLALDGSVKPDVVAPGVALATADPGAGPDGAPRYVTVNGSSAAAAAAAGAAALLAQARPALGAAALHGLLTGTAVPLERDPVALQGAGLVDVAAAAAGEVAATPATLALGRATARDWRGASSFTLTNLSTRTLRLSLRVATQHEGAAALRFTLRPRRIALRRGRSVRVHLAAAVASPATGAATADGAVVVRVAGGGAIRVPWAVPFDAPRVELLGRTTLSAHAFAASDTTPALLSVDAGRVLKRDERPDIRPLARLDVELWRADGTRVGLLARLRDVLPGRYTFGLTGRGPDGRLLAPGGYVIHLVAVPVDGGSPSRRKLRLALR